MRASALSLTAVTGARSSALNHLVVADWGNHGETGPGDRHTSRRSPSPGQETTARIVPAGPWSWAVSSAGIRPACGVGQ
jgi:hypothetical protein